MTKMFTKNLLILIKLIILINTFQMIQALHIDNWVCFGSIKVFAYTDLEQSNELLDLMGLYVENTLNDKIEGQLIYAKSFKQDFLNKILNKSDTDNKGCPEYLLESNEPMTFIPVVENQIDCSLKEQIEIAVQRNALGLIIVDTLEQPLDFNQINLRNTESRFLNNYFIIFLPKWNV